MYYVQNSASLVFLCSWQQCIASDQCCHACMQQGGGLSSHLHCSAMLTVSILRFSQQCCWRFKSSGVYTMLTDSQWHFTVFIVVADWFGVCSKWSSSLCTLDGSWQNLWLLAVASCGTAWIVFSWFRPWIYPKWQAMSGICKYLRHLHKM